MFREKNFGMNRRKIITSMVMFLVFGSMPYLIVSGFVAAGNSTFFIPTTLTGSETGRISSTISSSYTEGKLPSASGNTIPDHPGAIDEFKFGDGEPLPNTGYLSGADYNLFWMIHISDTQDCWSKESNTRKVEYFLNTTVPLIQPTFTLNTGDLVDSDYTEFFNRVPGQRLWEWEIYNKTFSENEANYTNYFDIIGNHDIYNDSRFDFYINYSISGQYFKTDQYLVNLNLPWGKYSFYYLSVPEDYGLEFPFALGGHMSKKEMAWFETKLEQNQDANLSFALGHMPPHQVFSALSPSGKMFIPLMNSYNVDYFGCGHEHMNTYQNIGGMAAVEVPQFDEEEGCYKIIAVDNDGISTSYQVGNQFPVGIITSPIDFHHAIGDYDMNKLQDVQKIRALAWDPDGVDSVEWRADGSGTWNLMTNVNGPLFEASFDSDLINGKKHTIEIKINSGSDTKIESIIFKSTGSMFFGWNEAIPLIILAFVGIVIVLPLTKFVLRRKDPEKYKHKPGYEPDMLQAKYGLIKFLILTFAPMAFTLAYDNTLTAVFSFWMIAKVGFIYTDIIMLFAAAIYITGIVPIFLHLSPKLAGRNIPWIFISLLFEGVLSAFFILRYPLIGLILPGYYGCIILDLLLLKRSVYLQKSRETKI
jgi:hypothetical protein